MSTLSSVKVAAGVATVATLTALYLKLRAELRRTKTQRIETAERDAANLPADRLVDILNESAVAAFQLIEQARKALYAQQQAGKSLEEAVEEMQENLGNYLETVVAAIRKKYGVSEEQMTVALNNHKHEASVQVAMTNLQEAMNGKMPKNLQAQMEEKDNEPATRGTAGRGRKGRKASGRRQQAV